MFFQSCSVYPIEKRKDLKGLWRSKMSEKYQLLYLSSESQKKSLLLKKIFHENGAQVEVFPIDNVMEILSFTSAQPQPFIILEYPKLSTSVREAKKIKRLRADAVLILSHENDKTFDQNLNPNLFHFILSTSLLRSKDGLSILRQLQKAEEREGILRERLTDLEENLSGQMSFVARLSHDVRTPLHQILCISSILKSDKSKCKGKILERMLSIIEKAAKQQLYIVNQVMDYVKLEEGAWEPEFSLLNLHEFVKEVFAGYYALASQKEIYSSMVIESDVPEIIETDKQLLWRVLDNFISNAIKYTEKGGVSLTVRGYGEKGILFILEDTGIGIPKSQLSRILEPYKRVTLNRRSELEGTGLGMAIAAEALGCLGGDLQIESELDQGCEIKISIPVSRPRKELSELEVAFSKSKG